jgi:hypothetical protein
MKVRNHMLDNRWIVPYNLHLLSQFDCHMNVEICSTIKLVKYTYKYIYKGHDKISYQIVADEEQDEIKQCRSARWISPPERVWRLYGFTLNEMTPAVITLKIHLPTTILSHLTTTLTSETC